jgi:hypothetical protein
MIIIIYNKTQWSQFEHKLYLLNRFLAIELINIAEDIYFNTIDRAKGMENLSVSLLLWFCGIFLQSDVFLGSYTCGKVKSI